MFTIGQKYKCRLIIKSETWMLLFLTSSYFNGLLLFPIRNLPVWLVSTFSITLFVLPNWAYLPPAPPIFCCVRMPNTPSPPQICAPTVCTIPAAPPPWPPSSPSAPALPTFGPFPGRSELSHCHQCRCWTPIPPNP